MPAIDMEEGEETMVETEVGTEGGVGDTDVCAEGGAGEEEPQPKQKGGGLKSERKRKLDETRIPGQLQQQQQHPEKKKGKKGKKDGG